MTQAEARIPASLGALRVLVVDDNENMRTILIAMLKSLGVRQVRAALDGEEALATLSQWSADLAIVDLRMTGMDGLDFTRRVRRQESEADSVMPIIMLTGHSDPAHVFRARDAGVNEFLAKPFSARLLVERLNAVLFSERPFIRCPTYCGPDRRRRSDPAYVGPRRRASDGARV